MISYFRVAEHNFAVIAPKGVMELPNYKPFEVSVSPEKELLFTLTIEENTCSELPVMPTWKQVYVDKSEDDMPRIEIYRHNTDWIFMTAINKSAPVCMQVIASEDFTEARLTRTTDNQRFTIDSALMFLFAFSTASLNTLLLHASVTVLDDRAYLFLGKSGTGKSTHSRLWQEAFPDAWLLNDDNPVVRVKDHEVIVYGTPWSGKTPCYINQSSRVGAFVKLLQAPYNKMHHLRLPEAYAYIMASSSGLKIVSEMMDSLYGTIVNVLNNVPVYGLECLPNTDAVRLCADTVIQKQ